MKPISLTAFRQLYEGTLEFAVIDPREELFFSRAHLFAATNMPLSRLELLIRPTVPDLTTMIVLCDDGEGSAERAALLLAAMGYDNLHTLDGGLPAWALSGGAVFSGMSVPSKAFGEVVEHELATPTIEAAFLKQLLDSGEKILLLDARPENEHHDYCIPGSISCPSAEMIHRIADLSVEAGTKVVVHCAGRTRSIIGAQTLIDAGLFPDVVSLRNGTPAWEFEGLITEKGSRKSLPLPSDQAGPQGLRMAEQLRRDWGIAEVSAAALRKNGGTGTRYLIDVRTLEEYLSAHFPGSRHVAGGQLLQTTERHLVVRNAEVVLFDSDGTRAVVTAVWLRRMGWTNVETCRLDTADPLLERGASVEALASSPARISVDAAAALLADGRAVVCDLRPSFAYRRGHIAGAGYLTRAEPELDYPKIPPGSDVLLMADDAALAGLVARDLASFGHSPRLIDGQMYDWKAAGHPVSEGLEWLISRPVDTYFEADHFESQEICDRENHAYLSWEIALIDHIVGEPAARFQLHPPART